MVLKELILNRFIIYWELLMCLSFLCCRCTGNNWPHTFVGVIEHIGCWGHQDGVQMHGGHPNIWGIQMPQTYGGVKSMPPTVTCH